MIQLSYKQQIAFSSLSIIAGNALYALTVVLFLVPSGLITGGATGIALGVNRVLGLPVSGVLFAINISIFVGYKLRKVKGALCTSLGTALPSFLIILAIAIFFHRFMDVAWVAAMFRGIRPAVVALIAVPTFNLAKSAKINLANCWIPIATALLIALMGVNPIYILIAAGTAGYLYGKFITPTEEDKP